MSAAVTRGPSRHPPPRPRPPRPRRPRSPRPPLPAPQPRGERQADGEGAEDGGRRHRLRRLGPGREGLRIGDDVGGEADPARRPVDGLVGEALHLGLGLVDQGRGLVGGLVHQRRGLVLGQVHDLARLVPGLVERRLGRQVGAGLDLALELVDRRHRMLHPAGQRPDDPGDDQEAHTDDQRCRQRPPAEGVGEEGPQRRQQEPARQQRRGPGPGLQAGPPPHVGDGELHLPRVIEHQRRARIRPTRKPIPAAMPSATAGWRRT